MAIKPDRHFAITFLRCLETIKNNEKCRRCQRLPFSFLSTPLQQGNTCKRRRLQTLGGRKRRRRKKELLSFSVWEMFRSAQNCNTAHFIPKKLGVPKLFPFHPFYCLAWTIKWSEVFIKKRKAKTDGEHINQKKNEFNLSVGGTVDIPYIFFFFVSFPQEPI